ncbi:MAG: hypothetical protein V3R65_01965 [Acidiferrobacterales bacterium]
MANRQRMGARLPSNYVVYGGRLVLRSRLNEKELVQILLQQQADILIEREIVV